MSERRGGKSLDDLSPERRAKVEALLARRRSMPDKSEEISDRELLAEEYRTTGSIEAAADPISFETMIELRRFISRLREYREREAISLATIANRSGIDMAALSRLENGRGNPTFSTLSRYVQALGLVTKLSYEIAKK